ncbi:hypothetical protein AVEN_257217-1 [Araneus ventricosus]|uniref:Uncharacterized protein n=1 Tax=Araneus ventricosus TaxID=182803 RepID=A0A4Y2M2W9_ARAVE|nr:hypothetical protein AVEN_257217-1 [Araneus ventricosus]
MRKENKRNINFATKNLLSDLLDNENIQKNSSSLQKKSKTISKVLESAAKNPESQDSVRFDLLPIRDKANSKQLVDVYLMYDSKSQVMDESKIKNMTKNKFYSYVANIIHNITFPEKGRRYKSRTKLQRLDVKKFYKLIYKSKQTGVPNGCEIVHKIANTLSGEDFESQTSDVIGMLTENNLNETNIMPIQSIRFKNSDDLPSCVQFVVIPYEDFEKSNF